MGIFQRKKDDTVVEFIDLLDVKRLWHLSIIIAALVLNITLEIGFS